jgi:hypothetical protein
MDKAEEFYILNMNIAMVTKESTSVVLYLKPLQMYDSDLHLIFKTIRESYLKYHIKHAIFDFIPSSALNYYINLVKIKDNNEEFSTYSFNVKFSNIRGYQEHKDRYIKLRDYLFDRRERNYKEED